VPLFCGCAEFTSFCVAGENIKAFQISGNSGEAYLERDFGKGRTRTNGRTQIESCGNSFLCVDFKSEAGTDITCTVRKERLYEMNRCLTFVHLTDNWITKRCACDPPAVARKADEKADSPGADR
jgi:hypothetical protein